MAAVTFAAAISTQTAFAQAAHDGPAPPPAGKNAEEIYKNIIQLKGTPADQLAPAMAFISASLGVECSFCHVPGKFELDDKPAKKTAREMMAMQASINKASFNGRTQVTCYSCQRPRNRKQSRLRPRLVRRRRRTTSSRNTSLRSAARTP
jgi:hypothetical protein